MYDAVGLALRLEQVVAAVLLLDEHVRGRDVGVNEGGVGQLDAFSKEMSD